MCAFCGPAPATPSWFDAGVPDGLGSWLRSRDAVVHVAREVVDPRVAGISSQPGTAAITVSTPDGRSISVSDYGRLWDAVQAVAGRPVPVVVGAQ